MVTDQRIHELIDILGRILHAIRPVFQVEVDAQSFLMCISYLATYVGNMLLGSLVQLCGTMLQRTFGQQVDNFSATVGNPVNALATIHETEHLNALQTPHLLRSLANHGNGFLLALADTCRSDLDAIDIDSLQEFACHHEFLVRQETDTVRLLPVTQRGVHDLNERRNALVCVYLLRCSHASILSLFSTKKSMSSRPFIRQCFL